MAKGDLGRFWNQLKGMDKNDPRRSELQSSINRIEQWMKDSGKFPEMRLTDWTKGYNGSSKSPLYPDKTGYIWYDDIK